MSVFENVLASMQFGAAPAAGRAVTGGPRMAPAHPGNGRLVPGVVTRGMYAPGVGGNTGIFEPLAKTVHDHANVLMTIAADGVVAVDGVVDGGDMQCASGALVVAEQGLGAGAGAAAMVLETVDEDASAQCRLGKENRSSLSFAAHGDDPDYCAEYADDVYASLFDNERRRTPNALYMDTQRDINPSMRAILIDWLVEVTDEYRLKAQTLYLTVRYIDRVLSVKSVPRGKLQLLGVAAMLVASKFEEIYPPTVDDFIYITANTYSRNALIKMECFVLDTLKFELVESTFLPFLVRLADAGNLDKRGRYLAQFYAERCLNDITFLQYPPSMVATAAVVLALHTLGLPYWSETLELLATYTPAQVSPCITSLCNILADANPKLAAVIERYRHKKLHRISDGHLWRPDMGVPFLN